MLLKVAGLRVEIKEKEGELGEEIVKLQVTLPLPLVLNPTTN